MTKKKKGYTLEEWKAIISREVDYVDSKPYSHNIINLALQGIYKGHGRAVTNAVIGEFNLDDLGWNKLEG